MFVIIRVPGTILFGAVKNWSSVWEVHFIFAFFNGVEKAKSPTPETVPPIPLRFGAIAPFFPAEIVWHIMQRVWKKTCPCAMSGAETGADRAGTPARTSGIDSTSPPRKRLFLIIQKLRKIVGCHGASLSGPRACK